eukprot:scaffold30654_cov63-Phaeocystis_antarctica.AAC.1
MDVTHRRPLLWLVRQPIEHRVDLADGDAAQVGARLAALLEHRVHDLGEVALLRPLEAGRRPLPVDDRPGLHAVLLEPHDVDVEVGQPLLLQLVVWAGGCVEVRQHQPEQRERRFILDGIVVPQLAHEPLAVVAVVGGLAQLLEAVAEALEGEVLALLHCNQRHAESHPVARDAHTP